MEDEQDRVELPEPLGIVVGFRLQFRPLGDEADTESVTVSVNPLTGDTVIIEVAVVPG